MNLNNKEKVILKNYNPGYFGKNKLINSLGELK